MRAAIIGLYNSGSSVLSQIVEDLGADIGRPLWHSHFESKKLMEQLRVWWNEPELVENTDATTRIDYLKLWAQYHEASSDLICAKHPLLSLSAWDLDAAWGPAYKAIRASRPLETSIRQLTKREWFKEPDRMQRTLFASCEEYFKSKEHLAVEYDELLKNPLKAVEQIADFLELDHTPWRLRRAASHVDPKLAPPKSR